VNDRVWNFSPDEIGGLDKMHERNREKAALLHDAIDASDGFYRGHAVPHARSLMNVTFRVPNEELDSVFVRQAAAKRVARAEGASEHRRRPGFDLQCDAGRGRPGPVHVHGRLRIRNA
jgi:phosphoserine aminotransferase